MLTSSAPIDPVRGRATLAWGREGVELDEAAASIRGWRVHFTQLSRGPCSGSVLERVLPSLRLVRLRFAGSVALHSEPLGEIDPFQVGVISSGLERFVWNGTPVREDQLMVADGIGGSNIALPRGCEFLVARLDRRRLEALAGVLRGAEGEPRDPRMEVQRMPSPRLDELRSELGALMRGDLTERTDVVETAERDVYQRVALALAAPREAIRLSSETRRRTLRRAEEYMRAHARDRISVADLCVASACSERTLRYVFQERYGLSPAAFLKRIRLQRLRWDLRDAAPRSTTVLDRALRWGFWHMGHLSRDYRLFFGETPTATLARTPRR